MLWLKKWKHTKKPLAAPIVSIPLRTAYVCGPCQTITASAPVGICQRCGSSAIRPVSSLLLSADERQAWMRVWNHK